MFQKIKLKIFLWLLNIRTTQIKSFAVLDTTILWICIYGKVKGSWFESKQNNINLKNLFDENLFDGLYANSQNVTWLRGLEG